MCDRCCQFVKDQIVHIKPILVFYIGWIFIHYVCSHLYIYYCTPATWYGMFLSPFLSVTPHCIAFRWVINEGGNVIYSMWISLSTYVASSIIIKKL